MYMYCIYHINTGFKYTVYIILYYISTMCIRAPHHGLHPVAFLPLFLH